MVSKYETLATDWYDFSTSMKILFYLTSSQYHALSFSWLLKINLMTCTIAPKSFWNLSIERTFLLIHSILFFFVFVSFCSRSQLNFAISQANDWIRISLQIHCINLNELINCQLTSRFISLQFIKCQCFYFFFLPWQIKIFKNTNEKFFVIVVIIIIIIMIFIKNQIYIVDQINRRSSFTHKYQPHTNNSIISDE